MGERVIYTLEEFTDVPVIRATHLLPVHVLDEFRSLINSMEPEFGSPAWASGPGGTQIDERSKRALCAGRDLWFPYMRKDASGNSRPFVPPLMYEILERFMLHQGVMDFCRGAENDVFRLLPNQELDGKMHIVSYGNGGYYNWHRDHTLPGGPYLYGESPPRKTMFTLSLCLCWHDSMTGGDLLFMKDNRTFKEPFLHNSMTIFPSTVAHAATRVEMSGEERWDTRRISCQFWMAGTQVHPPERRDDLRWL